MTNRSQKFHGTKLAQGGTKSGSLFSIQTGLSGHASPSSVRSLVTILMVRVRHSGTASYRFAPRASLFRGNRYSDVSPVRGRPVPGGGTSRTGRSEHGSGGSNRARKSKHSLEGLVCVRGFSIDYTANSLRFTGMKKRAGLTCRYPCCVVVPTTTIGVISNAYDLLRATPSAGPET
jgi:hypothetical protein